MEGIFLLLSGVHDSYWTHAGNVDKMNLILREKFVELYDQPILENVSILNGFPLRMFYDESILNELPPQYV